jgi:TRAP-type uncharacterized transport system fused permease subunit
MMQAWKYSLPAFLVPFLFSATTDGANLLILDANLIGFIIAVVNSSASLFYLSVGIVAFLRGPLVLWERAVLIVAAIIMAFTSIRFSMLGILPLVIGALVVIRNILKYKTTGTMKPSDLMPG